MIVVVILFHSMMASDRRVDITTFCARCISPSLVPGRSIVVRRLLFFLRFFSLSLSLSFSRGRAQSPEMKSPLHVLATGTCWRVTSAPAERLFFYTERFDLCLRRDHLLCALSVDAALVISFSYLTRPRHFDGSHVRR